MAAADAIGDLASICSIAICLAPFSHFRRKRFKETFCESGESLAHVCCIDGERGEALTRLSFPPLCCMFLAGMLWGVYGLYTTEVFPLGVSNVVSGVIGAYLCALYLEQAGGRRATRRWAFAQLAAASAIIVGAVAFAHFCSNLALVPQVLGNAACFASLALYAAPLVNAKKMLNTRSSKEMSLPLSLAITAAAASWSAYGVCVGDPWVLFTNLGGLVLAAVQIAIIAHVRCGARNKPYYSNSFRTAEDYGVRESLLGSEGQELESSEDCGAENENSPLLPREYRQRDVVLPRGVALPSGITAPLGPGGSAGASNIRKEGSGGLTRKVSWRRPVVQPPAAVAAPAVATRPLRPARRGDGSPKATVDDLEQVTGATIPASFPLTMEVSNVEAVRDEGGIAAAMEMRPTDGVQPPAA